MGIEEVIEDPDGVELIKDFSMTLLKGMTGAVTYVPSPESSEVMVEFVKENGETIEMVFIPRSFLRVFWKFKDH